jgi:hypothetical protein
MCQYRAVRGRYDWPWRGGPSFLTPDGSRVTLSRPVLGNGSSTVLDVIPDQLLRRRYCGGELVVGLREEPT